MVLAVSLDEYFVGDLVAGREACGNKCREGRYQHLDVERFLGSATQLVFDGPAQLLIEWAIPQRYH
jgi:hypothetical protein